MSKGSGRRPADVDEQTVADNWAAIFDCPLRKLADEARRIEAVRREVLAAKSSGMTLEVALAELDILTADKALAARMWAAIFNKGTPPESETKEKEKDRGE